MAARRRFGEICIQLGFTSKESVARALQIQKELQAGGMDPPFIGEILVREGFVTPEQRDQALEASGEIPADFIPGYEIVSRIGRGARGIVYKARQLSMDRLVALKILPRKVAEDRKYTEKFTREAKSVARLNHPNIISGIDVGDHEGCHYFVMEYVDGTSLAAMLRSERFVVDKAVDLVQQLAQALDHAHSHGIVHRDIKPDNILITREGVAKLCDYGLAGQVIANASGQRLKKVEGTPHYLSPEQAKGLPDIDIRSDIYSLGATVYHAMTGRPPFDGKDATEIMRKHLSEKPAPLKETVRGVRPSVQKLMDRLLEKDRDKRLQNPKEVLAAIGSLGKGPRRSLLKEGGAASRGATRKKLQLLGSGIGGIALAAVLGVTLFALKQEPVRNRPPREPQRASNAAQGGPSTRPGVQPVRVEPPKQPTATPGSPLEKEAEEAWLRITDMALESGRSLEAKKKVMESMEAFISKYAGTEAARQAEVRLTTEELAYETLLGRELDRLEKAVAKATEEGDFKAAAAKAADFRDDHDDPSFALQAASLIQQVEEANEGAFKEVEGKTDKLVAKEKFEDAVKLFADLEERSTDSIAERCREKASAISALLAKKERGIRLAGFLKSQTAHLMEHRFDEAREACEGMLEGEEDGEVLAAVEKQKDTVQRMEKTYENLLGNLEGKTGQTIPFTLADGEKWEGKITEVNRKTLRLLVKKTAEVEPVALELNRLSPEMLDAFARSAPEDPDDRLNGTIYFLTRGIYPPARRLYESALADGVRYPDWIVSDLEVLGKAHREATVADLLAQARDKMAQKAWKGARGLLTRVKEKFSGTETYKKQEDRITADLRKCWIEIGALDGPRAVVRGEVEEKKSGVFTFTYDFSKPDQLDDWIPDTSVFPAASRKHRGRVMEVLGKVNHKVRFQGDIEVEFTGESRAIRNPNVNILLNDGADLAYLFALGFKPRKEWVSLQVDRGDGKQPGQLVLPCNAILNWGRSTNGDAIPPDRILESLRLMGIWGVQKPIFVVKRKVKVKVAHTGGILQFAAGGRTLIKMKESSDGDTGGGVAFVPFGSTLLVHRVEITGRPDPDWLKEEVARRADSIEGD